MNTLRQIRMRPMIAGIALGAALAAGGLAGYAGRGFEQPRVAVPASPASPLETPGSSDPWPPSAGNECPLNEYPLGEDFFR